METGEEGRTHETYDKNIITTYVEKISCEPNPSLVGAWVVDAFSNVFKIMEHAACRRLQLLAEVSVSLV